MVNELNEQLSAAIPLIKAMKLKVLIGEAVAFEGIYAVGVKH